MQAKEKKISTRPDAKRMVENIIRCKWSLTVIAQIRSGINRPGAIERSVPGLSTKVLNERLRKLVNFGIVEKKIFPVVPPHVEYEFTEFGRNFVDILDAIEKLESKLAEN